MTWSRSRLAVGDTKIVVDCEFPKDRVGKQKLFAMWSEHKDALKAAGFSLKKNDQSLIWHIAYWHTVNEQSHVLEQDNTDRPKPQWRLEMERKLAHWVGVYEATQVEQQDQFTRPKRSTATVVTPPAPTAAPVTVQYENSVLDFEMELDEDGEAVSKPVPPTPKPAAAPSKPAAKKEPYVKVNHKPVRVDIAKLLDAPEEDY